MSGSCSERRFVEPGLAAQPFSELPPKVHVYQWRSHFDRMRHSRPVCVSKKSALEVPLRFERTHPTTIIQLTLECCFELIERAQALPSFPGNFRV